MWDIYLIYFRLQTRLSDSVYVNSLVYHRKRGKNSDAPSLDMDIVQQF